MQPTSSRVRALHTILKAKGPRFSSVSNNEPANHLLERERVRNRHTIENAPGWDEDLASASEAHVKADRSPTTLDDLRHQSVNYTHTQSPDECLTHREATYDRDEISGPLRNASVGEFEGIYGEADEGVEVDLQGPEIEPDGRMVRRRIIRETETTETSETVTREDGDPTISEASIRADRGD